MRLKVLINYPVEMQFSVYTKGRSTTEFSKESPEWRTSLLRKVLQTVDYDAPHMPDDFVVEFVEIHASLGKNTEYWCVAS